MTVVLEKVSKSFGTKTLFEDVSIALAPKNRYGLTGPNGSGKSTLLNIITKQEPPTSGSCSLPNRVSILNQNIHQFANFRVVDTVIMGNKRLWNALQERERLYEMEMTDEIGMKLGDLEGIIAEEDGYSAEANCEQLLEGIGVPQDCFQRKMFEIPTDMQFRALLCQALFGSPQALFLDEPTNHLDLGSIKWLELFLKSYSGVLVVVSHDRHFLNAVTTHIADIDYETIIIYPGNYDEMVVSKEAVRSRFEGEIKDRQKKIDKLQEFVSKFRSGTRASQVQSRLREIDRLQPQDLKKSNIQRPYIRFVPSEKQPGKVLLKGDNLSKSYGDLSVIKNFSFELHRGDKVGVIGNNGRGKTTLLKLLAKLIVPTSGKVEFGHNVLMSYFAQNHEEQVNKKDDESLFDWLKTTRQGLYDQDIRGVLGKMLFVGDDAFKKISSLSGGETARLILGRMMLSEHNLIILDEPNNHLDLEAVSALGWALSEYKGSCICSSHDRDLIDRFANKLIVFDDSQLTVFDGGLEEYLAKKQFDQEKTT